MPKKNYQRKIVYLMKLDKIEDYSWSISPELFEKIREIVPEKSTILELGSGTGTIELCKYYSMISIEHDFRFQNLAPAYYIMAPITPFRKACAVFPEDKGWYDRDILKAQLPGLKYDAILVDGPPNLYGRGGFAKWLDLFNTNVPIFVDDVERTRDRRMIGRVSAKLKRPYTVYGAHTPKHWAVIMP